MGNETVAFANRNILKARAISVTALGMALENPCVYFRPTAQTTSSKPARIRMCHDEKEKLILTLQTVFTTWYGLPRQILITHRFDAQ